VRLRCQRTAYLIDVGSDFGLIPLSITSAHFLRQKAAFFRFFGVAEAREARRQACQFALRIGNHGEHGAGTDSGLRPARLTRRHGE
jgi:hypothetical protein